MNFYKSPILYYFAFAVFPIMCCVGCRSLKTPKAEPQQQPAPIVPDTTVLPLLPAEAIYIIGQEWEAVHDSASAKFYTPRAAQIRAEQTSLEDFVEERLLELYPESVYPGYVQKVSQLSRMLIQRALPSASIQNHIGEELSFAAAPAELADMEYTLEEHQRLQLLDSIAMRAEWMERHAMDTLFLQDLEKENVALSLMLRYGPQMFYRVVQSKARAEKLAGRYYGDATSAGKRGDAFKHIYVNTMLRSYVGRLMAWLVMDVYWENAHPNAPCDHYMDAHNNVVGRRTHYDQFIRTDTDSDEPSWQQWADNIHRFIEDTTRNSSFQQWDRETPSFIVIENEKQSSDYQYIYWNRGDL